MEAPKEIFLTNSDLADEWDWVDTEGINWCAEQINDTDIAYIRKDIYDEAIKRLEYLMEGLRLCCEQFEGTIVEDQARIKELEEALKEYAKGSNWSRELDLGDSTQYLANSCIWKDDTQGGSIIARKALEKESEG